MKNLKVLLVAMLALAGCTDEGKSSAGDDKGAAAPVETRGKEAGGDFKADCFDCAVDGPGAFVELGISEKPFWKVGDAWQVLYQLKSDARTQMQPMELEQVAKPAVGLVVLDFQVIELGEHVIGGQTRKTATVKITQGSPRGGVSQVVSADEMVQVDQFTQRIDLVLNDLWQPVSVTEYTRDFPNGRLVKQDPRAALASNDSAFPYVVPNAYVGAAAEALPALDGVLAEVAAAANSSYTARDYFHFDLKGRGYDLSEQVFWAKGEPWPFLVETPGATGVLVSHNW
ncbi:MAG: hypothetical protein H6706_21030 [Myxococcales bacterium]|nr:hypothetical protein [Myxococcales bacterium]